MLKKEKGFFKIKSRLMRSFMALIASMSFTIGGVGCAVDSEDPATTGDELGSAFSLNLVAGGMSEDSANDLASAGSDSANAVRIKSRFAAEGEETVELPEIGDIGPNFVGAAIGAVGEVFPDATAAERMATIQLITAAFYQSLEDVDPKGLVEMQESGVFDDLMADISDEMSSNLLEAGFLPEELADAAAILSSSLLADLDELGLEFSSEEWALLVPSASQGMMAGAADLELGDYMTEFMSSTMSGFVMSFDDAGIPADYYSVMMDAAMEGAVAGFADLGLDASVYATYMDDLVLGASAGISGLGMEATDTAAIEALMESLVQSASSQLVEFGEFDAASLDDYLLAFSQNAMDGLSSNGADFESLALQLDDEMVAATLLGVSDSGYSAAGWDANAVNTAMQSSMASYVPDDDAFSAPDPSSYTYQTVVPNGAPTGTPSMP